MATPSSLLAQEPTKEDPYKDLNAFCICNHGMSLDIKPRDAQGKPLIHIDWSLTYNGPRTPVNIVKPSLEIPFNRVTVVWFYLEDPDKKRYMCFVRSPSAKRSLPCPQSSFVEVDKGKPAKGTITLKLERVREAYNAQFKEKLGASPPLRIQVCHEIGERGERFSLDAWTGELWSPVVVVPLEKNWWTAP
jgi:hypothetical protein